MNPRILLRLEGAAVLLVSLFLFNWNHGSWFIFVLLFLVPDLSMIGYLGGVLRLDRHEPPDGPRAGESHRRSAGRCTWPDSRYGPVEIVDSWRGQCERAGVPVRVL